MEKRPEEKPTAAASRIGEDDPGRTDDSVRIYLREMGGNALLTREGQARYRAPGGRHAMAAAIAAAATMSSTLAPRERSHMGRAKPCRKGPIARIPPACSQSL